jgi:uncharacterized membrane protein
MPQHDHHSLLVALFGATDAANQAMHSLQEWEKAESNRVIAGLCVVAKDPAGHLQIHRAHTLDLTHGLMFGVIAGAVVGALIAVPVGAVAGAAALGAAGAASVATSTSAAGMVAGTAAGMGVVGASGGAVAGGAAGAITGEVSRLLWGIGSRDIEAIGARLEDGMAALLALANVSQAQSVAAELRRLGGDVQQFSVPGEALDHVDAALCTAVVDTAPGA